MAQKPHDLAEEAFIDALSGKQVPRWLPRGPEIFRPSFSSSPNWTLLSRGADYIHSNRYNAKQVLEDRLDGELRGPMGFMMHEPHSGNYSRMHYAGWKGIHFHATKRDPELGNSALVWLQHFHFIRAAAMLPWGPPAIKKGASRLWGGLTDAMPGQRHPKVFNGGSTIEAVVGSALGIGQPNRKRINRSEVGWHITCTEPLGLGDELGPQQKKELVRMMKKGELPKSFAEDIYKVPIRVPLTIIRTDDGILAWMDRKIADKDALLAVRVQRDKPTQYLQGLKVEADDKGVVVDGKTRLTLPTGKMLYRIHQDSSGVEARQL